MRSLLFVSMLGGLLSLPGMAATPKCRVTETKTSVERKDYVLPVEGETSMAAMYFPDLVISISIDRLDTVLIKILDQNLSTKSDGAEELARSSGKMPARLDLLLNRVERASDYRSRIAVECGTGIDESGKYSAR